ncbi:MAG: hypothetical protein A2X96_09205 [Syntrophobacterales bacterium GWC2_56_13]|nr:MAG: hypothetical protein A2X96_09205 [Syntrophobacterales bacterium GWC2_56_13]
MPDDNVTISPDEEELIEKLRLTSRCRGEIYETSRFFTDLPGNRFEALVQHLIQSGESNVLGILMNITAVIGVRLPSRILAETLKMIDPIIDFHVPYRLQDASAIEPLLTVVEMEDVPWERQAYGALIAAELCLKHNGERMKVLKVLRKLSISVRSREARALVATGIALIEKEEPGSPLPPLLIDEDPLKRLPEERPPVVIGGDFSVRRPVPKIGRNAPCHCGSGKKYKKCCYEKDQEVLRDASPYVGLTMTQVRSQPGLVDDAQVIDEMRPHEIKRLAPSSLNEDQLLAAYDKLESYGLRESAFAMLLELKARPDQEEFAAGHMEDLLDAAIDAGETGLARRIVDEIPESFSQAEGTRLLLSIMEKSQGYAELEAMTRRGIVKSDEESKRDDPLIDMSYAFENRFPGLSVVFARAAMLGSPERTFDNEMLLDVIRTGRAELDLDPWGDHAEAYFDWTLEKMEEDRAEQDRSKEMEDLNDKLRSANELARQRMKELQEKERELESLTRAFQKAKEAPSDPWPRKREEPVVIDEAGRAIIERLRNQVDGLKADIRQRQQDHRALRRQLQEERTRLGKQASVPSSKSEESDISGEDAGIPLEFGRSPKKILVPEYAPAFLKACELMPSPVVAKALRSLANFAAHDETIWRQTRGIERLADVYRIRIDLSHRLLIQWKENCELKALDLILRRDLENWIKQYARSSCRGS